MKCTEGAVATGDAAAGGSVKNQKEKVLQIFEKMHTI